MPPIDEGTADILKVLNGLIECLSLVNYFTSCSMCFPYRIFYPILKIGLSDKVGKCSITLQFKHCFHKALDCCRNSTLNMSAVSLSTFVSSGLAPVLDSWDLPVNVFPFNSVLLLYLACTSTNNPYYPNHPVLPLVAPLSTNTTQLNMQQVRKSSAALLLECCCTCVELKHLNGCPAFLHSFAHPQKLI